MANINRLQSVRIQRFKRITDAPIDLKEINVLVGGNNSGKSSIIQGLHFGITLLQTIALAGKANSTGPLSTSLNPNELIYAPSEEVYALGPGGKLFENANEAISLEFNLTSGRSCCVTVRKGRNRNILVGVNDSETGAQLSNLEKPYSIFSPGLAGIAKRESYVSDGVLLRTIARGDANLVLRNILLRLWNGAAWSPFLSDLHDIFPNLELEVSFREQTDEIIDAKIGPTGNLVPLEIAGTGVLQAMQILSYIHRFEPSIVVLDEPDSHLHPNNQRLLCALLRKVAEERGVQVLLTTHSRHVVDALAPSCGFLWVRNGGASVAGVDDEIGILLDIGALDVKERASQANTAALVLTEDEITKPLESILESSGFDLSRTAVLPYYGITGSKQLRPLLKLIRSANTKAKVIVHRDRDFLTEQEVESWKTEIRSLGAEPFVTKGRDVESYFIDEAYLVESNDGLSIQQFTELIESLTIRERLVAEYVNGRIDIERSKGNTGSINHGKLAVEAQHNVSDNQCQGRSKKGPPRRRKIDPPAFVQA